MTYDALCRPLRADYPLGGYTVRSLVGLGNPAGQYTRTDAPPPPGVTGSSWTETYFDGLGRPWKTLSRGPSGGDDIVVEQRYGPRGLLVEATEPRYLSEAERVTSYAYDELGRVVRVELPGAREVTTSYEATSQTVTDPDGRTTTSRFDAYGRVIEVERTLNSQPVVTETSYDLLGRHIGMTDPAGAQWTWAYDSLGRLREEWDPDAGHRVYSYDKAGRPLTQTDAKGQTTTLAYDAPVGRLATRTNASGTVSFTYGQARSGFFNLGRLTQVSSPADTLQIDYDALGRVVEQRRTFESTTYTVEKELDPSGYLLSTTYPDGDVVGGLGYDGAGRLASIPGVVTAISYDALGRPLSRQHTNSTQTTWSYADPRGFLSRIQTSGAQGTVQDLQYTQYTAAGLLQQVTSPISGEGWSYAYDELGHMTTATHLQDSAQSQTFTFDGADRILTSSRYGTYAYPTPSQPRPHAPTSVNGTPLSYDLNGNVTQAGTRSLVWNADDRAVQATLGGVTTSFTYDGAGERLKKTSSYGTSLYPFGDDYEITNGIVTKYISVEGLGVVAKRVGYGASAVTYFLHADRLGSIQAVTSDGSDSQYPAGTVVSRRTYRPFGETLAQSGPHAESRGWIDQRNDPETGLTYLHARYFDPQLGVFLSADPIGIDGGLNQYAYGLGDSINGADRSGLCDQDAEVGVDTPDTPPCPPKPGFVFQAGSGSSGSRGGGFGAFLTGLFGWIFGGGGHSSSRTRGVPPPSGGTGTTPPAGPPPIVIGPVIVITPPVETPPGGGDGGGAPRSYDSPVGSATPWWFNWAMSPNMWGTDPTLDAWQAEQTLEYSQWMVDDFPDLLAMAAPIGGLPSALRGGQAANFVYRGFRGGKAVYAGITNDMARRGSEHASRFVIRAMNRGGLVRGEARAVEEALIIANPQYQNLRHSISPRHSWYQRAVVWGQAWLKAHGF